MPPKSKTSASPAGTIRGMCRSDGLFHESDIAQTRQARRLLKAGPCPLFHLRAAHEFDGTTDRRCGGPCARQRLGTLEDAVQ